MQNLTIYHSNSWKEVLVKTFGYTPFYHGNPGDEIFLPTMLVKNTLLWKKILCAIPFGEAGPVVSHPAQAAGVFDFLNKTFAKENLDYIELKGVDSDLVQMAGEFGFKEVYENFRFLIDLNRPIGDIHNNFSGTIKYDLRRKGRPGLAIVRENSIVDFYKLHLQTMKRLGTPPLGKNFFINLFECLGENVVMFKSLLNGRIISAIILLIDPDKNSSRYAFAVNDWQHKDINANTVLLFEAIKYSKQIGCASFDFGVSRPGGGVWKFKQKWCPTEPLKVFYLYKFRVPGIIDVRDDKIKLFSKIWKNYVPFPVANVAGPWIRKQLGK